MKRLVQLYAYDFSEIMGLDVDADALFPEGRVLGRWLDGAAHAFLSFADGHLAGFAIAGVGSRLREDPEVMDVADFFVLRKYRRKNVGVRCAAMLFDLFPRRWEVRERAENAAAIAFWRKAIHEYTGGRYGETIANDEHWRGPVQSFDARIRTG
jgi:predicted acetyltransferase